MTYMTSIPAIVQRATQRDLKPSKGRMSRLLCDTDGRPTVKGSIDAIMWTVSGGSSSCGSPYRVVAGSQTADGRDGTRWRRHLLYCPRAGNEPNDGDHHPQKKSPDASASELFSCYC